MKKQYINESFKHFLHGGDYNPEQWIDTKEIWDEDMRLMKLAHCNELSVGIFSWAVLEPREGEYDFSFLDEILDKIYEAGGRVFLATPSGARPHWLADKYPEVLRVSDMGVRDAFGARHNHCYTSPVYRKKVSEIDERLSERYGDHPAVLGWHISNEFGGECFCPLCKEAFRQFMKKKYGTVDKLNHEGWTTFWSHRYDSFDQINPPLANGKISISIALDWKRFVTEATGEFIDCEIAAIRKHSSLPVTTNFMHKYIGLNYSKLAPRLDFISWDSYPLWHTPSADPCEESMEPAIEAAISHDAFRALKQRPFALMESTPSNTNWQPVSKLKRPGMHKLSSIQAVAHGSDTVQYFQWRKSRGSNEKLHGAVVDHVGHGNTRVFRDVTEVGITLEKIEEVLGTMPKARVAVIFDVENDWALKECMGFVNADKKYYETCKSFYRELWRRAIDVDVIDAERDLCDYELVIVPMLYMTSEKTIENITNFVTRGGTLLATYALGMVNENDLCYLGGFPAQGLKDVFGIWNEELDTLYPTERNAVAMDGGEYEIVDYCERIHPITAEVLGAYVSDFYAGEPAVTVNRYGDGVAYYVAARDTGALKSVLLDSILGDLGITGNIAPSAYGVTAHSREDGKYRYVFVENYTDAPREATLGKDAYDLESGENVGKRIELSPYGVRILRIEK